MIFYTEGFLSKWGFGDGDMIDDLLHVEFGYIEGLDFEHDVLIETIKNYVLPKIENKYEFFVMSTHHNPARFSVVDGVEIDHLKSEENPVKVIPEEIEVEDSKILEIARNWLKTKGS